jgi:hypothetical protein
MWHVKIKSLLSGNFVLCHLGIFSTQRRAENAAKKEFEGRYEWLIEKV